MQLVAAVSNISRRHTSFIVKRSREINKIRGVFFSINNTESRNVKAVYFPITKTTMIFHPCHKFLSGHAIIGISI
jgi:hypothetical protein